MKPSTPFRFSFPLNDLADFGMALYLIVAQNHPKIAKTNFNRNDAANHLAQQLGITRQYVLHWFRGDFSRHPLTPEKFLQFVRLYQGKNCLEDHQAILTLAKAGGDQYISVLPQLDIDCVAPPFTLADLEQYLSLTQTFGDNLLGARVFKSVAEAVGFEKVLEIYRQPFPTGPCALNPALYRVLYLAYLTLPQYLQECFRALGAVTPREKYTAVELAALWEISIEQARYKILPALARHLGVFDFERNESRQGVQWPHEIQLFTSWLLTAYHAQLTHAQAYEDRLESLLDVEHPVQKPTKIGFGKLLYQIWFRYKNFDLWAYAENRYNAPPGELLQFAPITSRLPFLKPVEYLLLKKYENRPHWDLTLKGLSRVSLALAVLVFLFSIQLVGLQTMFTGVQIPLGVYSMQWVFLFLYVVSTLSYYGIYYSLGVLDTMLWDWLYGRYQ